MTAPAARARGAASFADEIEPTSPLYRTAIAAGSSRWPTTGQNTNGSQFFIMHRDYPLQPKYVIFARVTSGMDVVDALAETPTPRAPTVS